MESPRIAQNEPERAEMTQNHLKWGKIIKSQPQSLKAIRKFIFLEKAPIIQIRAFK